MKIITENLTGKVVFAYPDDVNVVLGERLEKPVTCFDVSSATHALQIAPENADFVGGCWAYKNGEWIVIDSATLGAFKQAQARAMRAASVPISVTMRQARLALLNAGLLENVSAIIGALPEPQKSAAHIEFEYSPTVVRHNGLVAMLAPQLGLDEDQIDDLFIAASTI